MLKNAGDNSFRPVKEKMMNRATAQKMRVSFIY